jgi:PPK2 family polyphosphate:nucleotide phosphotransferase
VAATSAALARGREPTERRAFGPIYLRAANRNLMTDTDLDWLERLTDPLRVTAGKNVVLGRDYDPGFKPGWLQKADAEQHLRMSIKLLAEYQDRLAAQDTFGLLVVLQGLDAAGKDGTVRHLMSGVNPQGVTVHSFKVPSDEELGHDFLWRYHQRAPARGQIGIFNRSHYEEVLVVRVHPELLIHENLPASAIKAGVWKRRYREINDWERYLVDNGVRVVKLFLHLSKEEQRRRFIARIEQPEKNWKFSIQDVKERAHWDDYQQAYEEMLTATSTRHAPWHVVPADHKWFARLAASWIILDTLVGIDPQYPVVDVKTRQTMLELKNQLEAEPAE